MAFTAKDEEEEYAGHPLDWGECEEILKIHLKKVKDEDGKIVPDKYTPKPGFKKLWEENKDFMRAAGFCLRDGFVMYYGIKGR